MGVKNLFLNRENLGRFWGFWIFGYEFLFTTARTSCHYVCELASSSSMQLCPCAHDYPVLPNMRKENLFPFYQAVGMSWSWNSIFNRDSPIIMSFMSTCIFPSTPCPQTGWSTRIFFSLIPLSSLLRTCNHELISRGLAHNLLKHK
jgi:hypothetical protein